MSDSDSLSLEGFQSPFGVGAIASGLGSRWRTVCSADRSSFNPLSGWGRLQDEHDAQTQSADRRFGFNPLSGWGRLQGRRRAAVSKRRRRVASFNPLSGWGRLQARLVLHTVNPANSRFQSPFGVGAIASSGVWVKGRSEPLMFQSPFGVGAIARPQPRRRGRGRLSLGFNPLSGWGRLQGGRCPRRPATLIIIVSIPFRGGGDCK